MERSSERMIDVLVLGMLLFFAWLMRAEQPGLAGVVIAASINFWLQKNATAPPEKSIEEAAAMAAAAVLATAKREQTRTHPKDADE